MGEGTRADYRDSFERLAVPFFQGARLAAVEPRDLKRYAADLAERGLAPSSVAKAVAPVRALFATAVEEGVVRSNPAAGLRIARRSTADENAEQVKALTEAQLAALLAEVQVESRLFFRFTYEAGLRVGEAIETRWRDVDFGGRWLTVERQFYRGQVTPPKGRKRRRVRLGEAMARDLWRLHAETRPGDDELIFTAEQAGGSYRRT